MAGDPLSKLSNFPGGLYVQEPAWGCANGFFRALSSFFSTCGKGRKIRGRAKESLELYISMYFARIGQRYLHAHAKLARCCSL